MIKFSDIHNSQLQQVDEAFANLGQLKAGPLLKMFNQRSYMGNKNYGGGASDSEPGNQVIDAAIGEGSKVLNTPKPVKSWKNLRSYAKADETVSGFALYADDKIFMLMRASSNELSSINRIVTVAFTTPDGLPAEAAAFLDNKNIQALTKNQYKPIGKQVGYSVEVRYLSKYVDDVIEVLEKNGVEVTTKMITRDVEGQQRRNDRINKIYSAERDPLADRAAGGIGGYSKEGSLQADLAKFKADKSIDLSALSADQLITWCIAAKQGTKFIHNGLNYVNKFESSYGADLKAFISGAAAQITISGDSGVNNYKNIYIKMKFDKNTKKIDFSF